MPEVPVAAATWASPPSDDEIIPVRGDSPRASNIRNESMEYTVSDRSLKEMLKPLHDPMVDSEVPVQVAATNTRSGDTKKQTQ